MDSVVDARNLLVRGQLATEGGLGAVEFDSVQKLMHRCAARAVERTADRAESGRNR